MKMTKHFNDDDKYANLAAALAKMLFSFIPKTFPI